MAFEYPSQSEVVRGHRLAFQEAVRSGEITPWPMIPGLVNMSATFIYLMLPRNAFFDSILFKWSILAYLVSYQLYAVSNFAVLPNRLGYCFGVMSCFGVLNWLAFVISHDAKTQFKRVDRKEVAEKGKVRQKYIWQAFPEDSLQDRLSWVGDLVLNFRGIGWNWQTLDAPGIPEAIRADLDPEHLSKANKQPAVSKSGCRRFDDPSESIKQHSKQLATACVVNMFLITVAWHDPYFAGFVRSTAPSFMPELIRHSLLLTRFYRVLLPGLMMYYGIAAIYAAKSMAVVLFGRKVLGFRADSWMQPDCGGPFTNILDRGLSGFWGGWWHQTFRFVFQSAAESACQLLRVSSRSTTGQIVSSLAVFATSGLLHASGSKMQYLSTSPISGTFMFFLVQGFGLIAEAVWRKTVYKHLGHHVPLPIHRMLCLVWVLTFFTFVGPIGTDDMATCQLWSFEVPELQVPKLHFPTDVEDWVQRNFSSQLFR